MNILIGLELLALVLANIESSKISRKLLEYQKRSGITDEELLKIVQQVLLHYKKHFFDFLIYEIFRRKLLMIRIRKVLNRY